MDIGDTDIVDHGHTLVDIVDKDIVDRGHCGSWISTFDMWQKKELVTYPSSLPCPFYLTTDSIKSHNQSATEIKLNGILLRLFKILMLQLQENKV